MKKRPARRRRAGPPSGLAPAPAALAPDLPVTQTPQRTLAQVRLLDTVGLTRRQPPVSSDEARWFLDARKRGDVPRLIEALRHPELRAVAVRRLSELGATEAIPRILPLLNAPSGGLRVTAARALGRLQSQDAYGKLIELSHTDAELNVRAWALFAIGCIGVRNDSDLVELAASPDERVRQAAIAALIASTEGAVSAHGIQLRASESRSQRRVIDRIVKRIESERTTPVPDARGSGTDA